MLIELLISICLKNACECMGLRQLPFRLWRIGVPTHSRRTILGVYFTCTPMKVLFQQLVLIPAFPAGQTGRKEEALKANVATTRVASGVHERWGPY